ncbi:MAG: PQQ-dependent sugar dehydrogenase, partial [Myxococcota bacterium]
MFPNLAFENAIAIRNAGDGSDYLYVADIYGRVYAFPNDNDVAEADTFLDLSNDIYSNQAGGLLGLAFHPDYEENRYFFVYYVTEAGEGPYRSRLARFTAPEAPGQPVDLETELILLDI